MVSGIIHLKCSFSQSVVGCIFATKHDHNLFYFFSKILLFCKQPNIKIVRREFYSSPSTKYQFEMMETINFSHINKMIAVAKI